MATSVRTYFEEQHRVCVNIRTGTVRTRMLPKEAAYHNSLVSPDLRTVANFSSTTTVQIHDLLTRQLLRQLELPMLPAADRNCDEVVWGWSAAGDDLTIPCHCPADSAAQHGLMFLNTESAACSIVQLQAAAGHTAVDVSYCTSRSLVLVHHVGAAHKDMLSVYGSRGQLHASTACPPGGSLEGCSWAPSGAGVAFLEYDLDEESQHNGWSAVWLWDLQAGPVRVSGQLVSWTAWATPSASAACIVAGSYTRQATVATFNSQQQVSPLTLQHAGGIRTGAAVWGTRLALLNTYQGAGYKHLELFSMHGRRLTLTHAVRAGSGRVFASRVLAVNGDGGLVCAVTGSPKKLNERGGQLCSPRLAVISLASGIVHEFPLQGVLAQDTSHIYMDVSWSADCKSVLVSIEHEDRQLFEFG